MGEVVTYTLFQVYQQVFFREPGRTDRHNTAHFLKWQGIKSGHIVFPIITLRVLSVAM